MPLWEPSMGSSHRLPNRYRGNAYANRYPSNSPINRISMVTNNRNNSCIVASGVYTWVRLKAVNETTRISSENNLVTSPKMGSIHWHNDWLTVSCNVTLTWVQFSSVSCQDASDRLARTFQQCSSSVCVARSVSRIVTTDRSRSAKTLVGTSQINSLASSGFTEQHTSPSEPQWIASTLPAVNKQQHRQPTSTTVARPSQSTADQ
jgi:hypothetical protein